MVLILEKRCKRNTFTASTPTTDDILRKIRAVALRPHALGQCLQRIALVAVRTQTWRPLAAAHRRYRPATLSTRICRPTHRRPAVARPRVGRHGDLPKRTHAALCRHLPTTRATRARLSVFLLARRHIGRSRAASLRRHSRLFRPLPQHEHRAAQRNAATKTTCMAHPRARHDNGIHGYALRPANMQPRARLWRLRHPPRRRQLRIPIGRRRRRCTRACQPSSPRQRPHAVDTSATISVSSFRISRAAILSPADAALARRPTLVKARPRHRHAMAP